VNFVLDASVTMAWCFEDEGGEYALSVLNALPSSEAVAATLWPLEVVNALLTAERRGRIQSADAARFLRLVRALPIVIDPTARSRAFADTHRLAQKHRLTAYDGAYLELAVRLAVPLATLDGPLRAAATAEGIALYDEPA
jgi:predicted nucleic acid-binding protein